MATDTDPVGLVVLGASAGGVDALTAVIGKLDPDLPAAVLVVLHVAASSRSVLPAIFQRRGPLTASHAVDGERLRAGHIYVAPPDHHMLVEGPYVKLSRGPKENGVRPAIDPMFRSAAMAWDGRTIAVILSGSLGDGTAGLVSVRRAGGTTIVQDPREAVFSSMPLSATRYANPDYVVPLDEIAGVVATELARRAGHDRGPVRATDGDDPLMGEERSARDQGGEITPFRCPECGGTLWEDDAEGVASFRCRVGHGFAAETLVREQLRSLEESLWAAVVALEERADLADRLAARTLKRNMDHSSKRYVSAATDARRRASVIREAILHLDRGPRVDDADETASQ